MSVGNDTYNLIKYDKIQYTDAIVIKYSNTGGYLLQNCIKKGNDENKNGKKQSFIKSTRTNSRTTYSGATSLPPIGSAFTYVEISSNNHGNNVLSVSNELVLYKSNITF